jgi:APA family basic amino acid/polyamine antiporter
MKTGKQGESGLKRSISLFQATMYGIGLILGAGIYVLIGDVAEIAGNALWISFVIAAVIATFTGLSYAELSSMFPKSAAEYVYVRTAFKNNMAAFVAGWLAIFVALASSAAVALGFSGYLQSFFPEVDIVVTSVSLVMALSVVNFIGIRQSIWMNTTFTIVEIVGLAIVVSAAVIFGSFGNQVDYLAIPPAASASTALAAGAILGAAGLAFFAFFGFENLANIAEETKDAIRTIPKALVISVAATTAIYISVSAAAVALVGWEELSTSNAPLALAAEKAFGMTGVTLLSAIALFATANTVLMMLVAGSRIAFGMSREGALPAALGKIHSATGTPWTAVILAAFLTTALLLISRGSISAVAQIAVSAIFMVYLLVNLALIWLRLKKAGIDRPFRSPFQIGRVPVLAALGAVTSAAMLTQFDTFTIASSFGIAGAGIIAYAIFSRSRRTNEVKS